MHVSNTHLFNYSTSKRKSERLMEGVEGLYKKFGVLADAKDKAGEVCIKKLVLFSF